jgi:hypothetical protein
MYHIVCGLVAGSYVPFRSGVAGRQLCEIPVVVGGRQICAFMEGGGGRQLCALLDGVVICSYVPFR